MSYPYDPNQQPNYGAPGYGQQQPYGAYPGGVVPGPEPDNNLVWAILTTVLCCLPLGIVAIVKSTSVSKLWAAGDFAGAQKAADDAKKWAMWGAIIGVVGSILIVVAYFIFAVLIIGASATTSTY
ncbi:CD225/dispanin family protein [Gordonia rubripertincta]|uniref:CD225/dispanin family protein n=1 Tax=Gordonia rubripertincta TaxID=36822 RepID=UPI000B8D87A8|nr:CD225/dispanin family protein [Gordonia rubripertincta]ASR01683.1 Interferon-induced transmembrane protein [Gordonia rubripertincta]